MRYQLLALFLLTGLSVNSQTILTIEGQTYTNSDETWLGVNIPRAVPTILTFKNNSISSLNQHGYMLQAGDDVVAATNNNLDGEIITGNKFIWSGSDMTCITHGLFAGNNINAAIKYNYLDHVPMGIIRKSSSNMTNTAGGIAYNIVKSGAVAVNVKGMSNVHIYNNTLYNDRTTSQTWRGLVYVYTNTDVTPNSVSHGTKIYNNIFYTKYQTYCIQIGDAESLTGFESDYNVFYCETGSPLFNYCGSTKTFAQWQALGYDTHSVVINPNFKDFINFVPATRLDYGKDLGSEWKDGLSLNAKWGTANPETTAQNGNWQVGARVYTAPAVVPAPVPVYSSSKITNEYPAVIEMTYNLTLANTIPAASAFTVKVNSVTRTVNSVAISGTKVLLTLANQVIYGDVITVAYTKPSSNPLQTVAGGQAASLTAQNVTNNVAAAIPVYVSSVIENATPSRLEMTYNLSLANIIPAISSFTVKVNSIIRQVSSVSVSGTKVFLTLANTVVHGDVITVAYAKPSTNPLQTVAGGQAASLAAQTVTNNRSAPVNQPPVVSISSPTKSTAFISPATITIDATASDPDGTVTKVEFYNGTVKFGELTAAPWSFTWKDVQEGTYTLTAAATDNSNSRTISAAVLVVVEKAAPAINQQPAVAISAPLHNSSFEVPALITLSASASDNDGSVAKVEYYIGQVKIGESLTPPYYYSFQCDTAGVLEITAVASDNLYATSTSIPISLSLKIKRQYPDLMTLYPNPTDGQFTVDLNSLPETGESITISIVSFSGITVYSEIITDAWTSKQIDISDSLSGNYIIMASVRNTILSTKQFIKL